MCRLNGVFSLWGQFEVLFATSKWLVWSALVRHTGRGYARAAQNHFLGGHAIE